MTYSLFCDLSSLEKTIFHFSATVEVEKVSKEVEHHLADNRRGERLREGVHVAIIGAPNVGKSSLLNMLCLY